MHKDGKWAKQIIALQEIDGKWGCFHSLSQFYNSPITTEQALRRLRRLGFAIEDDCIQKAVAYMNDCLTGKKEIPDRKEKVQDWHIFSNLILATWIRRFVKDNPAANAIAEQWAEVITSAFEHNEFNYEKYVDTYSRVLRTPPKGARMIGFTNFYPVSIAAGLLDKKTESAFVEYILNNEKGYIIFMTVKFQLFRKNFRAEKQAAILPR